MARFLLVLWLMVPWGVVAWYVGPGRVHLSEDRAGAYLRDADRLAAMEQWHDAALAYGVARDALAENAVYKRTQLRYAEAVARMKGGEQAAGRRQINQLLVDIERLQVEAVGDAEDTWELSLQVRNAIASSAYYAAWRLRLERAATKEWKSRLETAQQQFRKLVEQTDRRVKDSAAQRHSAVRRQSRMFRRNLEAAVLLGQVDLTQLAAWPLPEEFPEREHVLERKRIIEQELPLRSTLSLEE